jgi:16S rRNA (cytosine1402-N4)-methyltransferase
MKHISVLFDETIEGLHIQPTGTYVDATLGGGGHAAGILSRLTSGRLIGFDQDLVALEQTKVRLAEFQARFDLVHANFSQLQEELKRLGVTLVNGILMDIGVSSFQLDDPARGFSYHHDAPLDMRMDNTSSLTAATIVNEYTADQLRTLFTTGEVPFTNRLVDEIIRVRKVQPIETTFDLVQLVQAVAPRVEKQKRHPARLVFQALRLETNQELDVLTKAIEQALQLLTIGGRLVIITFHSLEDRIVKQAFVKASSLDIPKGVPIATKGMQANFQLITKKPIVPSETELLLNPRAKSAKCRIIERVQ